MVTKWNKIAYHPLSKTIAFVLMIFLTHQFVSDGIKALDYSFFYRDISFEESHIFAVNYRDLLLLTPTSKQEMTQERNAEIEEITSAYRYALVDSSGKVILTNLKKPFDINEFAANSGVEVTKTDISDIISYRSEVSTNFSVHQNWQIFEILEGDKSFLAGKIKSNEKLYACLDFNSIKTQEQRDVENATVMGRLKIDFENSNRMFKQLLTYLIIELIVVLSCFYYLSATAGYVYPASEIKLTWFDNVYFELQLLMLFPSVFVYELLKNMEYTPGSVMFVAKLLLLVVGIIMVLYLSALRKLRAGVFWNRVFVIMCINSVIGAIYRQIRVFLPKYWSEYNNPLWLMVFLGVIALDAFFVSAVINPAQFPILKHQIFAKTQFAGFILFIVVIMINFIIVRKLADHFINLGKLADYVHDIKSGDFSQNINIDELSPSFKGFADDLNLLKSTMQMAVEREIKSERMRTDLITNVSHDLKTPLTSIINYVDLLSKEENVTQESKKYIEVLGRQAHKLTSLINQLVYASKLDSGYMEVNLIELNIGDFLIQIVGEYTDILQEKELDLVCDILDDETIVITDSDLLYRLFDNLFNNIKKYALRSSRVYLKMMVIDGKCRIELKNISATALNISVDELLTRFVRGDSVRGNEGSGLGLAISQGIANIINANFSIFIDGDLFKAQIDLPIKQKTNT